jgi:hypothetical protein
MASLRWPPGELWIQAMIGIPLLCVFLRFVNGSWPWRKPRRHREP